MTLFNLITIRTRLSRAFGFPHPMVVNSTLINRQATDSIKWMAKGG